ncbi:hypothetical protein [Flindersiella endophytica]
MTSGPVEMWATSVELQARYLRIREQSVAALTRVDALLAASQARIGNAASTLERSWRRSGGGPQADD